MGGSSKSVTTAAPATTAALATTAAPETTTTSKTTTTTTKVPISVVVPPTIAGQVDAEALFAEAFVGYQEAFTVLRMAYTDPGNEELRDEVQAYYREPLVQVYLDGLDQQVTLGQFSVLDSENPNRVESLRLISISEDGSSAHFLACETLTSAEARADTGEIVYEGVHSSLIQVVVDLVDGRWLVTTDTADAKLPGRPNCDEAL